MAATPPEVRQARGFLRTKLKAGTSDISPRHFANAANEMGTGFEGLATLLSRLYSGGQGADLYREEALEQNLRSSQ